MLSERGEQHVFKQGGDIVPINVRKERINDTLRRGPIHSHNGDQHLTDDELGQDISPMKILRDLSRQYRHGRKSNNRLGYNPRDNLRAMAEYGRSQKPTPTVIPTETPTL